MSEQLELGRSRWVGTRNVEERTELSEPAIKWAQRSVRAELDEGEWTEVIVGASILIEARRALHVIVGQPSATGHGKQGLHPDRIAALRSFQIPVRIVFFDGGRWQAVWLDMNEPEFAVVQKQDKTRPRYGWWVRDMVRDQGTLYFPQPDAIEDDAAKQRGAPEGLFA